MDAEVTDKQMGGSTTSCDYSFESQSYKYV